VQYAITCNRGHQDGRTLGGRGRARAPSLSPLLRSARAAQLMDLDAQDTRTIAG